MCLGIIKDELMCRIDPNLHFASVEKSGCTTMQFTNKPMIGYALIEEVGMKNEKDFEYWIGLALASNPMAKSSKREKEIN